MFGVCVTFLAHEVGLRSESPQTRWMGLPLEVRWQPGEGVEKCLRNRLERLIIFVVTLRQEVGPWNWGGGRGA
jgi:hypothetical protein